MALQLTESNFKAKLNNWVKGSKSKRDELQEFIVFGVLHAQQNDNDFTKLSDVMVACEDVKAFPNQDVCDYIKKVINGVAWNVKGKVFKKANKKATIEYNIGYLESEAWYEFSKATKPAKEMDIINAAARWAKQLRENIDKGLIKDGQQDKAEDLLNTLVQFVG
ncbi:hypothetical protein [Vibrio phage JSF23]|jgi:hypothetical protein|uniref:Uncharacterized protein n=4 Tax=Icepovirus bengalense TaxID=2846603 RepID=A0A076G4C3_9CAUD|nr:hypothetical protein ViPhICP2p27 [Vibrio phage ICP2]ADX87780.1 hypothetical protein TU12-16_00130 [Vibrio phage ICP2_2006_A]AII27071.1 hypothetical protein ICP22011A_0027 [Vibrio phage ICP2_2011_A]ASV43724.1 hypothetical protein [Vibrio phage JSF23]ASV43820.1 hypothetical protein [Vibrio phage JSF27]ADX87709.1 hypothetical protein [Vibrio phage ICP2]